MSSAALQNPARDPAPVDAFFELVAQRAAELVLERLGAPSAEPAESEFLTIAEAADLMRAKRQRVDDLLSRGKLQRYKDGARVLVRRSEVLAYLSTDVAPALPRGAAARLRAGVAG